MCMSAADFLESARLLVDPATMCDILKQAQLRNVTSAKDLLLGLRQWDICDLSVVWRLRCLYNSAHDAKLWVPLTALHHCEPASPTQAGTVDE